VGLERANNATAEKGDTVRLESHTIRESIFQGAIHGAIVWTVYAIVECCFSSILPWLIKPGYAYTPIHWGFTVLLSGLYAAIGLVLGGLCGLCFSAAKGQLPFLQKIRPTVFFPASSTFILISAFAINLISNHVSSGTLGLSELPPLSVSLLLILALALSAGSGVWSDRLRFLTNPWTASILLLGLPWINSELLHFSSRSLKVGWAFAYFIGIISISYILQKTVRKRLGGSFIVDGRVYPIKPAILSGLALLVALGISFFLDQAPYRSMALNASPPETGRPNVILITMDTVRADHLSLYGYERETSPNLSRLSQEATVYSRAIAPADMTLPTHASIFTGLYPSRHGAHYSVPLHPGGDPLDRRFHTLAEILAQKGYLTTGVVANCGWLGYPFGLEKGFLYYDQRAPVLFLGGTKPFFVREGIRRLLTNFFSPEQFDLSYRRADEIDAEVFDLLSKLQKENRPYLLFINYMDAHIPYLPPPPFDKLYPGKINGNFTLARYNQIEMEVLRLEHKIKKEERDHLLSQYDGGIAYIDFHIGKLIERLKELGLYENCLIIITSDHGEAFGERNLFQHGVSVYQDQIYVPLIIKYPNVRKNVAVNETVSLCDLMPTILDILGYGVPGDIDGQSLLKPDRIKPREVMSESFPNGYLISWHPRFRRVERAIFSGQFKFISSTAGKRELYDLSKDPNEKENLYNGNGGISKELEVTLNRWLSEIREESGSPVKLDKGTLDRLKSLGYIK